MRTRAGRHCARWTCARGSCSAAGAAGLPQWPLVKLEVVREDVFDDDLATPQIPLLVSGPEGAEILGVCMQRFHQLAAEHANFLKPAVTMRAGKIYLKSSIETFNG